MPFFSIDDRKINSNSKKFTGKIISFIRKLRNENSTNLDGDEFEGEGEEEDEEEETQNETITILNDDDDFDIEDIEQVTDYGDSDNDQDDAYSIVSTPKPKLQPFFSHSITAAANNHDVDYVTSELNTSSLSSHNRSKLNESASEWAQKCEFKLTNMTSENDLCIFIDESDPLMENYNHEINFEAHLLIKNWTELKLFNEALLKMMISQADHPKLNHPIKLVIIGNDQYLNKFARSHLELAKSDLGNIRIYQCIAC